MNREELQAIAQVASKKIKRPEDLNEFQQMLTRITVEVALNVELDEAYTAYSPVSERIRYASSVL